MKLTTACLLSGVVLSVGLGCDGGRVPTAAAPQAENQRARTPEERIDHLIVMLKLAGVPEKNARAARLLGESGAEAQKAIPALEEAAEHKNPEVQEAARAALAKIRASAGAN